MTMSFLTTFKTCFCLSLSLSLSLSLLMAPSVAASEVCDDIKTVHATLVKYTADPSQVTESREVSVNSVFGFPNCHLQWSENERNELQHLCEYQVNIDGKTQSEIQATVDAQDIFLNDLTEELMTCMESKEFDFSATGVVSEHLGRLLGIYFEDDSVLAVAISGGSWSNVYGATIMTTYGAKRPDK